MSVTLIMLVWSSCDKENINRCGFDADFGVHSSGLTMMSVNSNAISIRLQGSVFMHSGEMKLEFINPEGYIVYTQNFCAPGNFFINETCKASHGIWKLRYTSIEGTGSIELHATYR